MVKTTVTGNAIVVSTTNITLSGIKDIAKLNPDALILKGEDGKTPVFAIAVGGSGTGSLNANGAVFSPETSSPDGSATITMLDTGICGEVKEYVANKYGVALAKLNALVETLPGVLGEIAAKKAAVMEGITVA